MKLSTIDRAAALRYMGVKGAPDKRLRAFADECEARLFEMCTPKYCWVTADIGHITDVEVTLSGYRLALRGRDIAGHLSGCSKAVLLGATLGGGADKLIRQLQIEDMAKALVCDALANAAVEQVCDAAEDEVRTHFPDIQTTWRFSPGYGDFPLDCQGDFLAAINANRAIGVCLSGGGLLTPTKSVTAVVGLSVQPVPAARRGCASCTIREKCEIRKSGGHCGNSGG